MRGGLEGVKNGFGFSGWELRYTKVFVCFAMFLQYGILDIEVVYFIVFLLFPFLLL